MPAKQIHTWLTPDGRDVKFKHKQRLSESGSRFDVWLSDSDDGREWRVDVLADDVQVVASYRDGELADVERPGWLEAWAATVRRKA